MAAMVYHNTGMPRKRKYFTLASLLDTQPAGLIKDPRYRLLWDHFMASEKLQKLRISRRCYTLLNQARVKPQNLPVFYRTYRLPRDSFFPLFLAVKSKWLTDRQIWKEKRNQTIGIALKDLPGRRKEEMKILADLEKNLHPGKQTPVWNRSILPRTIKRTREMADYSELDWQNLYSLFLSRLADRYRYFSSEKALKCEAMLILGFNPEEMGHELPEKSVNEQFRNLSKKYHPDRGGNAEVFRRLKTARDFLL